MTITGSRTSKLAVAGDALAGPAPGCNNSNRVGRRTRARKFVRHRIRWLRQTGTEGLGLSKAKGVLVAG